MFRDICRELFQPVILFGDEAEGKKGRDAAAIGAALKYFIALSVRLW